MLIAVDYSECSYWLDTAGDLAPRDALGGDTDVDIAIVGAGMTGLWSAYYLAKADPSLRIAVVEKDIAGFGASGRNGGWCSAFFPVTREKLAAQHGRDVARAMQDTMHDTVAEVGRVCEHEGIDADYVRGGLLGVAVTEVQAARVRAGVEDARSFGYGEEDYDVIEGSAMRDALNVADGICALRTPHCAAVHPAKLTRGLAATVEQLGVTVYERTAVQRIDERAVRTNRGTVKADVVIRATEGYTGSIDNHDRLLAPVEIFMIATEPLPESFWNEVGWRNRECVNDTKTMFVYSQRTADDRIALGGGGARYHLGSKTPARADHPQMWERIRRELEQLFPGTRDAAITHRWGGVIGVPRDWSPSVGYRKDKGVAWAGGYVGDGVATANLAGRTLRDLIAGADTDLTRLPWVDHRWKRWEPEPIMWAGINAMMQLFSRMDRSEERTGKPSRLARIAELVIGESGPSSTTS